MKLKNPLEDFSLPVKELKDGQVAIIVSWGAKGDEYKGRLVQRYENQIIALGMPSGNGWCNAERLTDDCRVRILPPGTEIVV